MTGQTNDVDDWRPALAPRRKRKNDDPEWDALSISDRGKQLDDDLEGPIARVLRRSNRFHKDFRTPVVRDKKMRDFQ